MTFAGNAGMMVFGYFLLTRSFCGYFPSLSDRLMYSACPTLYKKSDFDEIFSILLIFTISLKLRVLITHF